VQLDAIEIDSLYQIVVVANKYLFTELELAVSDHIKKREKRMLDDKIDQLIAKLKSKKNFDRIQVNYFLLHWIHTVNGDDTEFLAKEKFTRAKFLDHLRDGILLCKLANKLVPGSVENIHEGEAAKEMVNQKANTFRFLKFLEKHDLISPRHMFNYQDFNAEGKSGYEAVAKTVLHLGLVAQDKFNQTGLDIDHITEEVSNLVQSKAHPVQNFFVSLMKKAERACTVTIIKSSSKQESVLPTDKIDEADEADEAECSNKENEAKAKTDKVPSTLQEKEIHPFEGTTPTTDT